MSHWFNINLSQNINYICEGKVFTPMVIEFNHHIILGDTNN
jgi:hypothetical protein